MRNLTLRLLDANFNRSREALRVVEDFARFILNDAQLSGLAKQLRHDLCQAVSKLPNDLMLMARDTPGDVGTTISTLTEQRRADARKVVEVAAKRLTEALRCLEEYSKIDTPEFAGVIESLRYRSYDLEKQVLTRIRVIKSFSDVRLYVLLTEQYCKRPVLEVAAEVIAGGADCIQLREKHKTDKELLELARQLCQLCHEASVLFVINDRIDLAVLAEADGVHFGQEDLPIPQARRLARPHMILGKSTHTLPEATAALTEKPDYLAVGSIFGSETKPDVTRSGTELIRQVRAIYDGPIIAIGGINAENAAQTIAAGATGVAICQGIIAQDSPRQAATQVKNRVTGG